MARSDNLDGLNLADIFRGMFRRKVLIAIPLLIGVLGGELFLMSSKPKYLAEAQVLVQNLATPYDKANVGQDQGQTEPPVDSRQVTSQVSVMKSDDINARVVDQLQLDTKPEFNAKLKTPGMLSELAVALGFKDDPQAYTPKALAAKTLASDITVYPLAEANVIGIKSVSFDPEMAAASANAIADTYVQSTQQIGTSSNDRVRSWLSKQVDDLRAKVSASDNAVEKYRADAGLLKGATATLGIQQISEMNSQITVADSAKADAQAKADEIRRALSRGESLDASSDVLASPLLQNLKEQQVTAQRLVSEVSATYLPNHPKMIAAQRQLDAVNGQVRREALKVVESLQGQAKVADQRAATLRASLDKMKGSQADANFSDVKLQALQREADAHRTLLQTLLNRYADASARQDTSLLPGFARIIQRANVPAVAYFPKAGPTLILSSLAGLLLGLGFAFVAEILARPVEARATNVEFVPRRSHPLAAKHIHDLEVPAFDLTKANRAFAASAPTPAQPSESVRNESNAHILGSMPAALSAASAVSMLDGLGGGVDTQLAISATTLASQLAGFRQSDGYSSFSIASLGCAAPNAALASIATARALAAKGLKLVLLDLAPPAAGIESLLGIGAGPGLFDLISGNVDFTKIVGRDPLSTIHFIRLGKNVTGGMEATLAERLPSIIASLQTVYNAIIINAGEAKAKTVQYLVAPDVSIILATQGRMKEAASAAQALEQAGTKKAFLVRMELETAMAAPHAASA